MKHLNEIMKGFGIALLGTVATVLYILALSHLFIGRWTAVAIEGALAIALFALFSRTITIYLNAVMGRFNENDQDAETTDE